LIAEEQKRVSDSQPLPLAKRLFSWLNLLLGLVLLIWGVWYVVNEITLAELRHALALADPRYMVLALLVFLATLATKAARWQRQFTPRARRPGFAPSFWAMMLGQFMNTAVSFLRLGEIARVFALHQQTGISKLEGLGTLVLEKSLDLIMLVLTLVVLIPFVVVPDFITRQGVALGIMALLAFSLLYLVAYRTAVVIRITAVFLRPLPDKASQRLLRFAISGLDGLAAMRSKRLLLTLLAFSVTIAILSVLMPLALFPAFGLPFGVVEAALINIVVTAAGALPVPTPAKIGVFEFAVVFMLRQFGFTDEAVALSYALVFHLLIIAPQIIFGAFAAWRTNWRWMGGRGDA
jgi:glycosyltransferase 2 family protein